VGFLLVDDCTAAAASWTQTASKRRVNAAYTYRSSENGESMKDVKNAQY